MTARAPEGRSTEAEQAALSHVHSALLEQQAATDQVIAAIGRPGFELQPIFETVAEHAVRLCRADAAQIFVHDTDHYRLATASGGSDEYRSLLAAAAISPGQGTVVGRVGLDRRSVLVSDILADPAYEWSEAQRLGGFRSIVAIPMLSDDEVIGVISIWRREVDPFTSREIEVATTFAAQGAVAIRNANLMQQLEFRTQELAQSVEELEGLRAVGEAVNSTLDLHEVLSKIVDARGRSCREPKVARSSSSPKKSRSSHPGGIRNERGAPRCASRDTRRGRRHPGRPRSIDQNVACRR